MKGPGSAPSGSGKVWDEKPKQILRRESREFREHALVSPSATLDWEGTVGAKERKDRTRRQVWEGAKGTNTADNVPEQQGTR